ncbi:MAG: hypothetical protein KBT03_10860 [Bacteroidales bacterium]|nr:hypothetical protein [Candidatus Scybalousia scybalohippi]
MSTASNVTAAKPKVGGGVYVAPTGTSAPTDATTTLNVAFKSLGYVSEDGLTNTNSPSSSDVKAWGGDIVMSLLTEKPDKFKFKLIENVNVEVLKTVYGDENVTEEDGAIKITASAKDLPLKSWCFETVLNDSTVKRIYVPQAKITSVGDIVYKDDEAIGYDLEISAYPDASGNTHYEYID